VRPVVDRLVPLKAALDPDELPIWRDHHQVIVVHLLISQTN
jgi:hypothetical protein